MSVDLGTVRILGADAVGQPGQRRFRVFVSGAQSSALMWLEKEQLQNLSVALDHSLALISEGQILRTEARAGKDPDASGMPAEFPLPPAHEFQVGRMQLNFNETEELFELVAVPVEILMEPGQEPQIHLREEDTLSCLFTQKQAQALSLMIQRVVASGRPVCPYCQTSLDGTPHACVKQNGHRKIMLEGGEE